MNKKTNKEVLKNNINKSKILYIFMLFYITLGTIVSIVDLPITNYINLFDYIFNNLNFIAIFILPTFIIIGTKSFILIEENKILISRFKSKKQYFKFQITNVLKNTNILFLSILLLILIFVNLKGSFFNVIEDNYFYDVPNTLICLFGIIKVYLLIITFQIFNIIILKLFLNKVLVYVIEFLLIFLLYNSYLLPNIGYLRFIFPSTYFDFEYIFSSFLNYFVFSLLYFLILNSLLIFITKYIIIKKDIETGV